MSLCSLDSKFFQPSLQLLLSVFKICKILVISWNILICMFEFLYASTFSSHNCGLLQWHFTGSSSTCRWWMRLSGNSAGRSSLDGLTVMMTVSSSVWGCIVLNLWWVSTCRKLQYICNSSCIDVYVCICPEQLFQIYMAYICKVQTTAFIVCTN